MKGKIKNLLNFIGRAWSGGVRGKIGLAFALFAAFMFVQMFLGDVSIQRFAINAWRLNGEQKQLAAEQNKLDSLHRHIELLQSYSPDYVEELGLKYLNIGDPKTKILKI